MRQAASSVKRLALACALALGCARAPPPPTAPLAAELPPPCSVLAVAARRDELGLDDWQVAQLLALQKELERLDAKSSQELGSGATSMASQRAAGDTTGGRRRGGLAGGRRGGEAPRRLGEPVDREEALAQAFADNDTQVILQAEKAFTASQWERVRAIAEKYRMEYADRREDLKRRGPPPAR